MNGVATSSRGRGSRYGYCRHQQQTPKSLHKGQRVVLPNAPKIAFTGTPVIAIEKTAGEFGTYIDT